MVSQEIVTTGTLSRTAAFTRGRVAAVAGLAAVAALTLTLAPATAASASTAATSATTVGIADPPLISQSAKVQATQLAAMKAIGITSVRLDADWRWVQPTSATTYDWTDLDRTVASIRAAGMTADLILDDCPAWAAAASAAGDSYPQPASAAQFATYAAAVAARYTPKGVKTYEIGNEPNNAAFWQPAPSPAAYTADLVAAYTAIKAAAPSAFVLSGGLSPETTDGTNYSPIDFLKAMYAHGAQGHFDGLGYHPYSYPAMPNSYQSWSGWSQMNQTSPSLRSVMKNNSDSAKKIWITEVGAPSNGPDGVGTTQQATEMTQAITAAQQTSWIGGLYIYDWKDDGTDTTTNEDWFGLETASGAAKPAYKAVATATGSTTS